MAPDTKPLALWRRDANKFFTLDYLDDSQIVYANFRAVVDEPDGETVKQFGQRVVAMAEEKKARALVIDVRLNSGGNNFLGREFFNAILKSDVLNEDGRLFVTGHKPSARARTSATGSIASRRMFVGEPTGSRRISSARSKSSCPTADSPRTRRRALAGFSIGRHAREDRTRSRGRRPPTTIAPIAIPRWRRFSSC
jgi:hypothetical protein